MNDKIGAKHNEDVHAGMQDIPANNNNKGSDSQAFLFQRNYRKSSFDGRGGGELFNLAKMVVSVLHKDLERKVEKLKYKKLEVT